jgi:hypothetical protein
MEVEARSLFTLRMQPINTSNLETPFGYATYSIAFAGEGSAIQPMVEQKRP